MEDLLTIAIPVYKRTDYIRSALNSAVNQSVKCRIVLIDNNSPHNDFKTIVESYNNPLIKYIKTDVTVPMVENFNNCFKYTETPWLTILHDDDMLHFQFAELAQALLKKYGNFMGGFVVQNEVSEHEWANVNEKITFTDDIRIVKEQFFYFSQLTPFPGVVVNRETAVKLGGFNAIHYPMEDFDFWYRYCSVTPMLYVNQKLAYYRISPTQDTVDYMDIMINNVYKYRLKLVENGKYNNFITRLALEHSRINNIRYFTTTYPDYKITKQLFNHNALRRAEKVLNLPLVTKFIRYYKTKLSFKRLIN